MAHDDHAVDVAVLTRFDLAVQLGKMGSLETLRFGCRARPALGRPQRFLGDGWRGMPNDEKGGDEQRGILQGEKNFKDGHGTWPQFLLFTKYLNKV